MKHVLLALRHWNNNGSLVIKVYALADTVCLMVAYSEGTVVREEEVNTMNIVCLQQLMQTY